MSPAEHAYLDMKYDASSPIGLQWAGYTSVRDAYVWAPTRGGGSGGVGAPRRRGATLVGDGAVDGGCGSTSPSHG